MGMDTQIKDYTLSQIIAHSPTVRAGIDFKDALTLMEISPQTSMTMMQMEMGFAMRWNVRLRLVQFYTILTMQPQHLLTPIKIRFQMS